jgi:hypothetical protein
MGILQELQSWIEKAEKFFPAPAGFVATAASNVVSDFPLLQLLNSSAATPKFPLTIPGVTGLLQTAGIAELNQLFSAVKGVVPTGATTPANPIDALKNFFNGLGVQINQAVPQVESLLTHQLIIGASLLSIVNPANLDEIFIGQSQYFFGHVDPTTHQTVSGYLTVANEVISPPALPRLGTGAIPTTATAAFKDLGSLLSKKTGEQYIRDLTRVGLEAVANKAWNLITRYPQIVTSAALPAGDPLKIKDASKAQAWFKGFADFAEANVTAVVEQALSQGGGPVQANPLLAASIATAAGTAARKSAQHIFLREIGIS